MPQKDYQTLQVEVLKETQQVCGNTLLMETQQGSQRTTIVERSSQRPQLEHRLNRS